MHLHFGQLQEQLAPHARYTVIDKDADGHEKWELVGHKEFLQRYPRADVRRSGVLCPCTRFLLSLCEFGAGA